MVRTYWFSRCLARPPGTSACNRSHGSTGSKPVVPVLCLHKGTRTGEARSNLDLRLHLPILKRLFLLRHAKSSWDDPGIDDHDRPLAPRGRRASALIAEHLRRERIAPGLVLCSSARRTQETLERVMAPDPAKVRIERELYGASSEDLLRRLREVSDEVESVMLIGHQPAIQELALDLAGEGPELVRVKAKFPTAALATLAFAGGWSGLGSGSAELVAYVKPKQL
jgi:phosphohistidine phosphatase